jgi:membrane protein implicated in regulation of membrane protease activity
MMDTVWRVLFLLLVGPVILAVALCLVMKLLVFIFPYAVLMLLIVSITAGVTAGLAMRRRLPPRGGGAPVSGDSHGLGSYRTRRPRGLRDWR